MYQYMMVGGNVSLEYVRLVHTLTSARAEDAAVHWVGMFNER